MSKYQPITPSSHADKRWKRHSNYLFAANDALAVLTAHEIPRAGLHFPIAFLARDEAYIPVAILGIQPGQNVFVAPDGRWLGGYVPAIFRAHPFALASLPNGQHALAFDMESELMGDEGEAFFDDEGKPAQLIKDALKFLSEIKENQAPTRYSCEILAKHKLLHPWKITVQTESGERQIEDLYRIDERALNELSAESLKELQLAEALHIAYIQLLSTQHLSRIGQLTRAQHEIAQKLKVPGKDELDLSFLGGSDTFSFGGH